MENNEHDNEQASQDLPQPPVPELGVDHVEIRCDTDYMLPLIKFFTMRGRRI